MNRWQLFSPSALIGLLLIVSFPVSAAGQLLVADYVTKQVSEYNLDGSYSKILATTSDSASGMAFGTGTDMFVVSKDSGSVSRYNWLTGGYLGSFDSKLSGLGGVLYDNSSNTLYVSEFNDYAGYRILKCNASTGANRCVERHRGHVFVRHGP